jgi:hypothetical protein
MDMSKILRMKENKIAIPVLIIQVGTCIPDELSTNIHINGSLKNPLVIYSVSLHP